MAYLNRAKTGNQASRSEVTDWPQPVADAMVEIAQAVGAVRAAVRAFEQEFKKYFIRGDKVATKSGGYIKQLTGEVITHMRFDLELETTSGANINPSRCLPLLKPVRALSAGEKIIVGEFVIAPSHELLRELYSKVHSVAVDMSHDELLRSQIYAELLAKLQCEHIPTEQANTARPPGHGLPPDIIGDNDDDDDDEVIEDEDEDDCDDEDEDTV